MNPFKSFIQALLIAVGDPHAALPAPSTFPSGSLIPTLLCGRLSVRLDYPYGYAPYPSLQPPLFEGRISSPLSPSARRSSPAKLPTDNSTDYIKRVIGSAREIRGRMIGMPAHINGRLVARDPCGYLTLARCVRAHHEGNALSRGLCQMEVSLFHHRARKTIAAFWGQYPTL